MNPTRGKYLCEILSRDRRLASGLWIADKMDDEKKDNVARVVAVGNPAIKECRKCHEKKQCKRRCAEKNKLLPIIAQEGDIVHFKPVFGVKMTYEGKRYVVLVHDEIVAIEKPCGSICAPSNGIIIKKIEEDKIGSIYVADQAKLYSGDYYGKVISVGRNLSDQIAAGDEIIYDRNEGIRFRPYRNSNYAEYLYSVKRRWLGARRVAHDQV